MGGGRAVVGIYAMAWAHLGAAVDVIIVTWNAFATGVIGVAAMAPEEQGQGVLGMGDEHNRQPTRNGVGRLAQKVGRLAMLVMRWKAGGDDVQDGLRCA